MTIADSIGQLAPISLEHLNDGAARLRRVDRKYLVAPADVTSMIDALDGRLRVLEIADSRQFEYRSLYFDDDMSCYHDALRGHRRRFKVRQRMYVHSGERHLEVKLRTTRGETAKVRIPMSAPFGSLLDDAEQAFVQQHIGDLGQAHRLRPSVFTDYSRITLLDVDTLSRVTIDQELRGGRFDGAQRSLSDVLIVETKSARAASAADHALWQRGRRPQRWSKFAVACALSDPTLPANRWNRVLRTHCDWQPNRLAITSAER